MCVVSCLACFRTEVAGEGGVLGFAFPVLCTDAVQALRTASGEQQVLANKAEELTAVCPGRLSRGRPSYTQVHLPRSARLSASPTFLLLPTLPQLPHCGRVRPQGPHGPDWSRNLICLPHQLLLIPVDLNAGDALTPNPNSPASWPPLPFRPGLYFLLRCDSLLPNSCFQSSSFSLLALLAGPCPTGSPPRHCSAPSASPLPVRQLFSD